MSYYICSLKYIITIISITSHLFWNKITGTWNCSRYKGFLHHMFGTQVICLCVPSSILVGLGPHSLKTSAWFWLLHVCHYDKSMPQIINKSMVEVWLLTSDTVETLVFNRHVLIHQAMIMWQPQVIMWQVSVQVSHWMILHDHNLRNSGIQ